MAQLPAVTLGLELSASFCDAFWTWLEQEASPDRQEDIRLKVLLFDKLAKSFAVLPTLTIDGGLKYVPFVFRGQTLMRNEQNMKLLSILSACNVYIFSGSKASVLQTKGVLLSGESAAFVT